jgi:RNA polymerase sigma factor (sigma-70 family)
MMAGRAHSSLDSIQILWGAGTLTGLGDRQLLERFLARGEPAAEAAFAALVRRHGPMVLRVCRQLLGDRHAAEDAFQATFLVLARRAHALRQPDLLAPWLFGVATRTARKAGALERTRLRRQRPLPAGGPGEPIGEDGRPEPSLALREEAELLHQELVRLPEKYREPVILCHFEGLTHEEAAQRLRCPATTLSARLVRARELLRSRLTRRGVAPVAALTAALLPRDVSAAGVPGALAESTARMALRGLMSRTTWAGVASATTARLVAGELRALGLARLRAGAALLAAILVGTVLGVAAARPLAPDDDPNVRPATAVIPGALPAWPQPAAPRPIAGASYQAAPGYDWVAGPTRHEVGWYGGRTHWMLSGYHVIEVDDGDLLVTFGHRAEAPTPRASEYRAVAFDPHQRRHLLHWERRTRCTSEVGTGACLDQFRLDHRDLPPDQVRALGIERLTLEPSRPIPREGPASATPQPPPERVPPAALRFPPSRDSSWAIPPSPIGGDTGSRGFAGAGGGVVCSVVQDRDGFSYVYVAYPSRIPFEALSGGLTEFRPVAFDPRGNRYRLEYKKDISDLDRGGVIPPSLQGLSYQMDLIARRPDELSLNRWQVQIADEDCDLVFVRGLGRRPEELTRPPFAFDAEGKRRRIQSRDRFFWIPPDLPSEYLADTFVHCYPVCWAIPDGEGATDRPASGRFPGPDQLAFVGVERMNAAAFRAARLERLTKFINQKREEKRRFDETHRLPDRSPRLVPHPRQKTGPAAG